MERLTLQYLIGLFYDQEKSLYLPCPTTSASFLFLNLLLRFCFIYFLLIPTTL